MNKDYRDHDYEDRRGREYWFYYDSEDEVIYPEAVTAALPV